MRKQGSAKAAAKSGPQVTQDKKVRENRARRAAERQGMKLLKSWRRDPRALDYGKYALVALHVFLAAKFDEKLKYELSIDQVEGILQGV